MQKAIYFILSVGLLGLAYDMQAKDLIISGTGGKTSFPLSNISEIAFESESMQVLTESGTEGFAYDEIQEIKFGEDLSAIRSLQSENLRLFKQGNIIYSSASGSILIFNLEGKQLLNGIGSVDVSSLDPGVYVVSSDGLTFKFTR